MISISRHLLGCLLAGSLSVHNIPAQMVGGGFESFTFRNQSYRGEFGFSIAGAGDTNADGFDDFLIGHKDAGEAILYSGADLTILHTFDEEDSKTALGYSVSSAGDFNGDGYDDVLFGAPFASLTGNTSTGAAFVFSGLDHSLLLQLNGADPEEGFGSSVSGGTDVNGDGVPDIVIGSPNPRWPSQPSNGSVTVYSGAITDGMADSEMPCSGKQ